MHQQKKDKFMLHAKLSQLLVGGAFLLGVSPAYAVEKGYPSSEVAIVQQQGRTITGIIKDATGETVIGANVMVKGTTNGTITDIDGKFTLNNVSEGATLVVSFVGYKEQIIKVGNQSSFNITLKEDSELIDEVVVVGYAAQKKVNLSGSVSSVKMDDIAEKRPITNLSSGLAGMAAGISVRASNNAPGNDDASILVRGQGTLNNSSPLVIIDGVEGSINSVAPQDVESMSVLKDAASASIYGSRAANGVILITTKKGKQGKVNIDYTGYMSLESLGKTVDAVTNYADYMELRNEAKLNTNPNAAPQFDEETIQAWRDDAGRNPILYPNTNWVDEVFESAVATNHNISLSGGTDKLSFYTSFGYNSNPGIMDNAGYERYSFRTNVEAKPTKWLTLGMKVGGYLGNSDIGADQVKNVFTYSYASSPGIVLRHPDGRFGGAQAKGEDIQSNNPLVYLYGTEGEKKKRNIRTAFNGTITPLKGLSITGSYTYELTDDDNWSKPKNYEQWDFAEDMVMYKSDKRLYVYNYNRKREHMFMDAVVRYENKFFDNRFDLSAMLGASQEMDRDRSFSGLRYDLIDPSVDVIGGATGDMEASGGHTEWAMRSYFGRINLGWDSRYLLEMNLRADASSRFQKNNRWGYFPSFSAAWRIDQESFMENTRNWLDALKFRMSYGKLGNNYTKDSSGYLDNYMSVPVYNKVMYGLGQQPSLGMTLGSISNGDLTWESTAITNFAVDFGTLNNRLTGTVEYFYKKTSDILINLPAPLVHGNSGIPTSNSAEVVNKGFELNFNWKDKINDFNYYIGTNVTFVDNKVTKFKGDEPSINGSVMIKEGLPINVNYTWVVDRIVQTQEDLDYVQSLIDNAPWVTDEKGNKTQLNPFYKFKRPQLGDVLYKDTNNDGVFDDDDRVTSGHGNTPRFFYDINLGCDWKGFDFSMLMSGTGKYMVQYQSMRTTNLPVSAYQIGKDVIPGRWYEGRTTPATYPRLLINDGRNTRASDLWETNKRFFKIRNIQLGYTLPQQWVKAASLSRVRVFCSLENFFTFTGYAGMDPETSGLSYPSMRQASFGLNVSF